MAPALVLEYAPRAGRPAAFPLTFDGTVGLFQPEDPQAHSRDCAVLFLSPWGFEDMCSRKFYRLVAEALADRGLPSLRFDFPGTGDSLDIANEAADLALWEDAALQAASRLRQLTGRKRLILIGQGLGGALAHLLASRLGDVQAIAMLAPVTSGRAYLREVAVWSRMVDIGLGLRDDQREVDGVAIAGLVMPAAIAEAVRKIDIARPSSAGAEHYLIVDRPSKAAERSFPDRLAALGADVTFDVYSGYDELVSNPSIATMPLSVVDKVAAWAAAVSHPGGSGSTPGLPDHAEPLVGKGFIEIPLRFGAFRHLFGVLTLPEGRQAGAPVLVLSTSYDRHAGWGRMGVTMARQMAEAGVPSLRYDAANVADSPPRPGAPAQVLYSSTQGPDVLDALDLLLAHAEGPAIIAGRCSGGYQAYRSAVEDPRLAAVVSVNPFVLYWDPRDSVDEKLRFVPRSLDDYSQRLVQGATFKRLVKGDIDIPAAARNIVIALWRRAAQRVWPLIGTLPGRVNIGREVRSSLESLKKRETPVTLVYSEGDVGLEHIQMIFGPGGRKLSAHDNVRLVLLPDADHNLTPAAARQAALVEIIRASLAARTATGAKDAAE